MKIVFLSNYINHHQVPLSDELFRYLGEDYKFIATIPIHEWRRKLGYEDYSDKPYVLSSYESASNYNEAIRLINAADVVIVGSSPEEMIKARLQANKITFRYAERYFKKRPWYFPDPRVFMNFYLQHTRYRKKNLFLLAASAYTANDVAHFYAYPNKVYKWGYFPAVDMRDYVDIRPPRESEDTVNIMWCSRFIDWKHPELPVLLAKKLMDAGYQFHIDMYGSGVEFDKTVALTNSLKVTDSVTFCGNKPNAEILEAMCNHDIFLFTSDKGEGWGAVLNESMSKGCAVVASNMIGSAPFLIEDGKNGLLFKSEDIESLFSQTKKLLDNPNLRHQLSQNAVRTMQDMWSPKVAAGRFLDLVQKLLNSQDTQYTDGPCSKAYPYKSKL